MSFSSSRIAAGLSLEDVSREFGVPPSKVEEWEKGAEIPPAQVVRAFDVLGTYPKKDSASANLALASAERQGGGRPRARSVGPSPSTSSDRLIKSKERVADHGEVFTPPWLVEQMLDLVKGESERIESRFLEPACGSGNFLVAVLNRKLATVEAKYGKQPFDRKLWALQAVACCYGIELLKDNIAECRANMLEVFAEYLGIDESHEFYRAASHILSLNLVHGNAMTMQTVPQEGEEPGPIMIVEWTYLKAGKFNRRDWRLEVLTKRASFDERWAAPDTEQEETLFGELRPAFHHRGRDEIFRPIRDYPPMTVRQLAEMEGADE